MRTRQWGPAVAPLAGLYRVGAELVALVYIAIIAEIAGATGAFYVMFPELGALSHDVYTRPRGAWASAPLLLAITPVLTAVVGTIFTRNFPYGYLSVLLTVASAIVIVLALRSPIAPAISAGLLPLVLGVKSWWYPPGIVLGTVLLAVLSGLWKAFCLPRTPSEPARREDAVDDLMELAPGPHVWLPVLLLFVVAAVFVVNLTGLRFVLFPPLMVIGFEMFGHTAICPWAKKPLLLPVACFLTAAGGFLSWKFLGAGPAAAACSMAWGIAVLRAFDLHVPPALAVALLPLVMASPTAAYPFAVGIGTALLTVWFLAYRAMSRSLGSRAAA